MNREFDAVPQSVRLGVSAAIREIAMTMPIRHTKDLRWFGSFLRALVAGNLLFASASLATDYVPWTADLGTAMQLAASREQLILLHFTSDDCPPCRRLEQYVFNQPTFGHAVAADYVPVKINVAQEPELRKRFAVNSWPTDVLITPDGRELHRMVTPQDATKYLSTLRQVVWHYREQVPGQSLVSHSAQSNLGADQSVYRRMAPHQQDQSAVSGAAGTYSTAVQAVQNTYGSPVADTSAASSYVAPAQAIQPAPAGMEISNPYNNNNYVANSLGETTNSASPAVRTPTDGPTLPSNHPPAVAASRVPLSPPHSNPLVAAEPGGTTPSLAVAGPAVSTPSNLVAQAAPPSQSPSDIRAASMTGTNETLGIEGFCAVAVMEEDRWVPGDPRWGARHRGRLYLFHDAVSQQRFMANPDRYSPILAGYDPVVFAEQGQYSSGRREHGVRYNDRMYLFDSEANLLRFSQQPDRYAEYALRAMGVQ